MLALRKSLVDIWDHGPFLFALNLATTGASLVTLLGIALGASAMPRGVAAALLSLWAALSIAGIIVCAVVVGHVAVEKISFASALRASVRWLPWTLFLGVTTLGLVATPVLLMQFTLPNGPMGVALAVVIAWCLATWLLIVLLAPSCQRNSLQDHEPSVPDAMRLAAALVFDDPWFSIRVAAVTLLFSISAPFMIPGVAGALVFVDNTVALRIRKYRYLAQPDVPQNAPIPWAELTAPERVALEKRSLKTMIFPWKA